MPLARPAPGPPSRGGGSCARTAPCRATRRTSGRRWSEAAGLWGSDATRCHLSGRRRWRSRSPAAATHAGVRAAGAQASGARSQPIRHRSGRFRISTHRGYAAAEWSGSTWRFQVRLQQPLGISQTPATQPISVRALSEVGGPERCNEQRRLPEGSSLKESTGEIGVDVLDV
jgi:hypothetical protein